MKLSSIQRIIIISLTFVVSVLITLAAITGWFFATNEVFNAITFKENLLEIAAPRSAYFERLRWSHYEAFLAKYQAGHLYYTDLKEIQQWRIDDVKKQKTKALLKGIQLDDDLRIVTYPNKNEIECPKQDDQTAVLLITGQSNSTNFHEKNHTSAYPGKVVNYNNGKCYEASSPLVGGGGLMGESSTLLGDQMIQSGLFSKVILIPAGTGGTNMYQWKKGERFNKMLIRSLDDAKLKYKITHFLWQHGEADASASRLTEDYKSGFFSMVSSIRENGLVAPIFVAVGTHCYYDKIPLRNPTSYALQTIPDSKLNIFPGPDTDKEISDNERYDRCHFNAAGQEKWAKLWTQVITEFELTK